MNNLFFLAFIIGGVAIPVLVLLGVFKRDKEHYKRAGMAAIVTVVSFVGFIATADEVEEPEVEEPEVEVVEEDPEETEEDVVVEEKTAVEEPEEEPEPEPAEEAQPTSKNKIIAAAKDVLGSKLIEAEYMDATDHYNIYAETSGLSANMDKKSTYFDTSNILEKIQGEEFSSLYFEYQAEFVDDFGDSEQRKGITYDLTKETVDKINFDSFLPDKLPDIADSYWQHPAFN